MRRPLRVCAAVLLLLVALPSLFGKEAATPEAAATLVLYNRNDPSSRALAKYYAERRQIPFDQVLGLKCSLEEEISRAEYLATIEAPVRDAFTKRGWWTIERRANGERYVAKANKRFVALMRGMPLKIAREGKAPVDLPPAPNGEVEKIFKKLGSRNDASVDSELSALFALDANKPGALISNPYYRRFERILYVPPSAGPLLVCRLDAPTESVVRAMIDDAIAVEKTGLWGWAYLDARNIHSGGYEEGDRWLRALAAMMVRQGVPVILDESPEVFPAGYPVKDAAVYYGWYTADVAGPFAKVGFSFVPGAIAAHIHSFSARTLRDPKAAWAAPLLMRGAAATVGNVYEPYLALTVNLDVMQDRLMSGLTLAESAYAGYRLLSWMGVVLGDPLYRPYAEWREIRPGDEPKPSPFRQYRAAVLEAGGDAVAAAPKLRALAAETGNSLFLEALGQAQAIGGDIPAALSTLARAEQIADDDGVRFRIVLEQLELLRRTGKTSDALRLLAEALGKFRDTEQRAALDKLAIVLNPSASR